MTSQLARLVLLTCEAVKVSLGWHFLLPLRPGLYFM